MTDTTERDSGLRSQVRRLELVNQVAQRIASTLDLQEILDEVVYRVHEALDCNSAAIGLVEKDELNLCALLTEGYLRGEPSVHPLRIKLDASGLTALAARTNQIIYTPDVTKEPRYRLHFAAPQTRSALIVPFELKGTVVGIIDVLSERLDAFDDDDIELLRALAGHVAAAVRNAQLHQALQRQLQQIKLVQQTSAEIAGQLELPSLLQSILDQMARLLKATGGGVYLYDAPKGVLTAVATYGSSTSYRHMTLRVGEGAAGRAVQSGEPINIPDYQAWPGRATSLEAAPLRSVVSYPLRYQDKIIGALNLSHRSRPGHFTDYDLQLMGLLGNQIAIAIANARLFEETQRRARRQTALFNLSSNLASALSEEEVYRYLVNGLHNSELGYEYIAHFMVDPRSGDRVVHMLTGGRHEPIGLHLVPGLGITERTLKDGKLHYSPDVLLEPSYVPGFGVGSEVDVPLVVNDEVVGVLAIESQQVDAFGQDDFEALTTAANQAGIAIARVRLLAETQLRLRQLEIANSLSLASVSNISPQALIEMMGDKLREMQNVQTMAIGLYDESSNLMDFRYLVRNGERLQARRVPQGEGMASIIIQSCEPLLINERFEARAHELGITRLPHIPRSYLGVPIVAKGKAIGVLSVHDMERENAFDESDQHLMMTLGATIGAAIENARLFAETRQYAADTAAVMAVSTTASQSLDLDRVINVALDKVLEVTDFDGGAIALIDKTTGLPTIKTSRYFSDAMLKDLDDRKRLQVGVRSKAMASGQAVYLSDFSKVPDYQHRVAAQEGYRSTAFIPLKLKEQVLGLMGVASRQPHEFPEREQRFLESIAHQLSLALSNAKLHEETKRQVEQLRLLNAVGQRVMSILSPDALVQEVAELIYKTFGYPYISIALVKDHSAEFVAASGANKLDTQRTLGWRVPLERTTIVTHVAQSGRYHLTNDVSTDPYFRARFATAQTGSELAVPIKLREQVIGVLNVESDDRNAFDMDDVSLMETLAAQLAAAFDNARLFSSVSGEQRRLAAVLEHVADGVIIADSKRTVLQANQSAARLFGTTPENLSGMDVAALLRLSSGQPGSFGDVFQRVISEQITISPRNQLAFVLDEQPNSRTVALSMAPVRDMQNTSVEQVVIALWDVSKQVKLDQMRDNFIAVVSHELRTPLWKISLATEELNEPKLSSKKRREYLDIIASEAVRLHEFAESLLGVSEVRMGQTLKCAPLALDRLLRARVRSYKSSARGRAMHLTMPAHVPCVVGDEEKLVSVLDNLIDNALKYSPARTPITIELTQPDAHAVQIAIHDKGTGLTADEAEMLFQPFQRLQRFAGKGIKGHGLGLYIVKTYVEAHGGRVGVQSANGDGTTFWFTLPVVQDGHAA